MARYEGQAALGRYMHRKRAERRVNDFADLLADGLSVREAAAQVGQKPSWGTHVLAQIKRQLGAQAC